MKSYGKLILIGPENQDQEFTLSKSTVEIGRATQNDIVLKDGKISRTHASIECNDQGCTLIDLKSANGTFVNEERIRRTTLSPGDTIKMGETHFRFERMTPPAEPEVTMINTMAELNHTLSQTMLETSLNDVSQSRLVIHTPEKTWEVKLIEDALTIGRHPTCDVVIDDIRLSRQHARIERKRNTFTIHDLESTNGTWMGENRIEKHKLTDGDTIRVGEAQLVFKSGFKASELTIIKDPSGTKPLDLKPIVFVPGLMGSELWKGSEQVWPNVRYLFSRPDMFRLPEFEPLEARGIVKEVVIVPNLIKQEQYRRLGDYLEEGFGYERGHNLIEFAYDWRKDVREAAKELARTIEDWKVSPPITIIAHSLGCLVSRYYVECVNGKDKVDRLILLGGPHAGAPHIITSFLTGPDLLPFGLLGERFREIMVTFPSMYQFLPVYACVDDQTGKFINVLEDEEWLPEHQRPLLRIARDFHRELGNKSSVPTISIFGYGIKTVTKVTVNRDVNGIWQNTELTVEESGDNRVPECSSVLPGSEIHPVQQHHGALYIDNDVKMRLKLELSR
jgi:pSer/pThr/pTyr-binding forkhead associated (FHA) protein